MGYLKETEIVFYKELCKESLGEEITEEIIDLFFDNVKLVYYICDKLSTPFDSALSKEDMIQEGYIGLWKASLTFDKDKGYKFSTYAIPLIRASIFMMLKRAGALKTPKIFRDIRKSLFDHGFTLPLDPMEADILLSEGKFSRAQLTEFLNFSITSLDGTFSPKDDSDEMSFADFIEDKSARIEYQFSEDEIEEVIDRILVYIKPEHRDLVEEWMYATLGGSGITQGELAKKYNVSQPQASRVLRSAIYLVQQHGEEIRSLFGI